MHKLELPEPDTGAKQHSAQLLALIENEIQAHDGWIDFAHYMQLALYAPGLGYYSAGLQKFGEQGDFITAPEVSPLFGRSLARPLQHVLQAMGGGDLLEFGAGSGRLAADVLNQLQALQSLPEHYYILELSAELRQRQYHTLQQQCPDCLSRVSWLEALPEEKIDAVVIANEVLDAMPVQRFVMTEAGLHELGVSRQPRGLALETRPADARLQAEVRHLQEDTGRVFAADYMSEINRHLEPWLASLAQMLNRGVVYLIDYGYPRDEYYLPERNGGTFMGYYRHRAFDDPLWYPGLQDMTAFVDFTAVAEAAVASGFELQGFTSQGNFLLDCGLLDLVQAQASDDSRRQLQLMQQMKTLTLNTEMGERFKVMGLSLNMPLDAPGFRLRDYSHRL